MQIRYEQCTLWFSFKYLVSIHSFLSGVFLSYQTWVGTIQTKYWTHNHKIIKLLHPVCTKLFGLFGFYGITVVVYKYKWKHKHNLRTSMNERTHFFIKIYISHTLFSKGLMFLLCVRDGWRDIYSERERTSSSHIFFQEPGGANACTPLQTRQRCLWSAASP